ncbi:MAG: FN3 associated domain-containing protein [Candidatus Fimadaptatus sp.]
MDDTRMYRRSGRAPAAPEQAANAAPAQPRSLPRSAAVPGTGEVRAGAPRRNPQSRPAAQAQPDAARASAPARRAAEPQAAPRPAAAREDAYARRRPAPPVYDPDEIEDDEVEPDTARGAVRPHNNRMMLAGVIVLSVMALILLVICFLTFTSAGQRWKATMGLNAPAYAYRQLGDEALASGNAAAAAAYYESALERDSQNYEGALKLAETLMSAGNSERAERAYRLAISLRPTETEPYDRVLELMTARGAGEDEMVDMLRLAYQNTAGESYHSRLLTYGPSPVRFSPEEGEYSQSIQLQMASDEGATIYYTTDGSQPTIYSSKYVLPIELGEGVFSVRAIACRNDLYSGETSKTYTIAFPKVMAPQFASKPGKYESDSEGRKVISVTVPEGCTVYYTTDGSAPSAESSKYEEGISLRAGTYKVRMVACNADGELSAETSADYEILAPLAEPFTDDDRFKSFFVDVTTQDDVNKQFKKLVSTSGDTSTFFTQHYSFGEVDFTVKDGVPLVTAVRITNNDITGVRGTKVGWSATDVIALFRDEQNDIINGERELYTLDHGRYGWVEYNSEGDMTSVNYMYTRDDVQLVELHYTIVNGKVSAMEYCISDM